MEENVEIDFQQSNQYTSDKNYRSDNHSESMSSAKHKLVSKQSATICDKTKTHDSTIDTRMKHQNYKNSWIKYSQSQGSRHMGLIEFM